MEPFFLLIRTLTILAVLNVTLQASLNDNDAVVIEANDNSKKSSRGDVDELIAEIFNSTKTQNTVDVDNDNCECVRFFLCSDNGTIITDGANIIDIRSKVESCSDALEVCCKVPLDPNLQPTPPTRIPDGSSPTASTHIPDRVDYTGTTPNPDKTDTGNTIDRSNVHNCGIRNVNGVAFRIIGDVNSETQFGEFPWMIAVLFAEKFHNGSSINMYQCGGSLIHPQVVMTAAHCVVDKDGSKLVVRAGEWDTQTRNEYYSHVDRQVSQVIVHESFHKPGLHNDIALLVTSEPFELTSTINTVCLPPQSEVPFDVTCVATGWGKNVFGKKGEYQVILKKVELPVVPRDDCLNLLRKTRLGRLFNLHESFMCAGGILGQDTCRGDGGGPLACPMLSTTLDASMPRNIETAQYQQSGIVAWGIGCGSETPGVYVNVANFRRWIDHTMHNLRLDTRFYTYNTTLTTY